MDHYYIPIVLPLSQTKIPEKSPYEHLILILLYSYYCTTIPIEFYHFYTIISLYHHYTIIPLKKYKITMRPLFGDHTIVSPVLYHYSQRNPIKHPMEISPTAPSRCSRRGATSPSRPRCERRNDDSGKQLWRRCVKVKPSETLTPNNIEK